jgi:threonine dehydrogenase-like Zn-dependent dehydrogenase
MITHRIPLQDIQQGFRYASEANESLKVVVVPDNSF